MTAAAVGMTDDRETRLRNFLARYLRVPNLRGDEDFFASGLVSSLFAMQLVMFIEKEFGITVVDDDLELDNFYSIDAILRFVERKIAAL